MEKSTKVVLGLTLIAAVIGVMLAATGDIGSALSLKGSQDAIVDSLERLFVVSLLVERAVEVVISVFRDAPAQQLKAAVDANRAANLPVEASQKAFDAFANQTREMAFVLAAFLGTFVAVAGVRSLAPLYTQPNNKWFGIVDVLITGFVLAGGSAGIHQIINVISTFMAALTAHSETAEARAKAALVPLQPTPAPIPAPAVQVIAVQNPPNPKS